MGRFAGSDQRLYLKVRGRTVEGMIKVGARELFYRDRSGRCKELSPVCVLDFYVHEKLQRQGLGKSLFSKMLISEKTFPNKLAYDRPSPKLLKFLQKHFELQSYVPQNNNFVIFDQFFAVSTRHAGVHRS
jgi:alpha-tubulin N-acetyltransferase 1